MKHFQESGPEFIALTRRALLGSIASLPAAAALGRVPVAAAQAARVRPGASGWPSPAEWRRLSVRLGGRLVPGDRPFPTPSPELLSNPFFVGDQPGLTQSSGWLGAWRSSPSVYAVRAQSAADVAIAVRFARRHRLRLVVKGGGHSYIGGSNAPDSLLVWTRAMDSIDIHDGFVPAGCSSPPMPAVSLGAGCIWGRVYRAVCVERGRYVQGGGCTTVGVAGLVQGGGFGSFSKGFGIAAASLLEAEIVTADGEVRIVNACRHPDLFWALKGGGGGTFGIVTRLTLRTHELPASFGAVGLTIQAASDEAFERLLAEFLEFSGRSLITPHWGEQVSATPRNRLIVKMNFQGLTAEAAKAIWTPFVNFVQDHSAEWKLVQPLVSVAVPAQRFWDGEFLEKAAPEVLRLNHAPGARRGDYWWAGDGEQVGAYWSGYASAWLSRSLLLEHRLPKLARAWFNASRHATVTLHFNKGLAGASPETLARSADTAMNPQVLDAFALAIIGAAEPRAYEGWSDPDLRSAEASAIAVHAADRALRAAAPRAGSYLSECDYFLENWKVAAWGANWQRLDAVKRRYDPDDLFIVHHGVGSERWSSDGFRRVA